MNWPCEMCLFFDVCPLSGEPCDGWTPTDEDIVFIETIGEEEASFVQEWLLYISEDDEPEKDWFLFFDVL